MSPANKNELGKFMARGYEPTENNNAGEWQVLLR